ncbi:MAG: hypothetical protein ACFFFH_13815 [Candidatus Thorarchaeota archaeon]
MTAEVARKMVEKAGIDVEKLLELMVKNTAAELTKSYYYPIFKWYAKDFETQGGRKNSFQLIGVLISEI